MGWLPHPLQQVLGGSIASSSPALGPVPLPHGLASFLSLLWQASPLMLTFLFSSYRTLVITQTLPKVQATPHLSRSDITTSSKSLLWKTTVTRSSWIWLTVVLMFLVWVKLLQWVCVWHLCESPVNGERAFLIYQILTFPFRGSIYATFSPLN